MTNSVDQQVQQIFDKVIAAGHYEAGDFMCNSLESACRFRVISIHECEVATAHIKEYLQGEYTLTDFLKDRKLPHYPEDRLKIYQNWSNKP